MIERIIGLAIQRRWVVVTLAAVLMFLGGLALTKLPIDAVPDITNKQVQINTVAPALSPAEIEKQITFPIETALAGAPGLESTRSLSRNGFSQITCLPACIASTIIAACRLGGVQMSMTSISASATSSAKLG